MPARSVMKASIASLQSGLAGSVIGNIPAIDDTALLNSDLTSAEMTAEVKDQISHRGESLRAITPLVAAALSDSAVGTWVFKSADNVKFEAGPIKERLNVRRTSPTPSSAALAA